ncbi:MAG: hypothetical protein ACRERC_00900 [Candidatus Binatia bacterium]
MSTRRNTKGALQQSTTVQPKPTTPKPMTDAQRAEVLAYAEHARKRRTPPRFELLADDKISPKAGDDIDLFQARLAQSIGSPHAAVITHLLNHAANAIEGDAAVVDKCNTVAALLTGIGPRDEQEGMLAVQMIATHNLALSMVRRAFKTDRVDFLATYSNLSAKLMNAYTRQFETLARLRGQTGQQTVRVEHVTVQAGGQAVVGNVAPRGRGDGAKS